VDGGTLGRRVSSTRSVGREGGDVGEGLAAEVEGDERVEVDPSNLVRPTFHRVVVEMTAED
jgi:hypothetical protein